MFKINSTRIALLSAAAIGALTGAVMVAVTASAPIMAADRSAIRFDMESSPED